MCAWARGTLTTLEQTRLFRSMRVSELSTTHRSYSQLLTFFKKKKMLMNLQATLIHCGRLDVCKSGVRGAGLNRNMK